jgi:hypothetical protein
VDVILYQEIAQDAHSSLAANVWQKLQVNLATGLTEEDRLSIGPSLRDLVRDSRDYDFCRSWHLTPAVGSRGEISELFAWNGSGHPAFL